MRTALNIILQTSLDLGFKGSDDLRSSYYVNNKISEEIWEIDEEIQKLKDKVAPGKDGVAGETIDTLISAVDLYALFLMEEGYSVEQMEELINKELGYLDLEEVVSDKRETFTEQEAVAVMDKMFKEIGQISRDVIEKSLIMEGVSYKVATKEESFKSFVSLIAKSLDLFHVATFDISPENEKKATFLNDTVFKKVSKWREKRDINPLSRSIEVKKRKF